MRVPTAEDARTIIRLGLPAAVVLAGLGWASPAVASTPADWPDADPVSTLRALLIFGGIPFALAVLIALLTVAPRIARGSAHGNSRTWWGEPLWFGGPGELAETSGPGQPALSRGAEATPAPAGSTAVATASMEKVGGAGARW